MPPGSSSAVMAQKIAPSLTTIRTATLADLGAVDRLLARSYPAILKRDYPPSVMVLAVPRISRAKPELLRTGTYYVVEGPEGVVAAGGWTAAPPMAGEGSKGVGHIRHVATDPAHLRQGHARRLLAHILSEARTCGVTAMACLSTRTAEPFYASLGFVRIDEVDVPLGEGIVFPSVRMSLRF